MGDWPSSRGLPICDHVGAVDRFSGAELEVDLRDGVMQGGTAGEMVAAGGIETVGQRPLPNWWALQLVGDLAHEVSLAHQQSQAMGCADLSRIDLSESGVALLPGSTSTASFEEDVCGLGAILYLLLTGYWPLPISSGAATGVSPAPRDERGVVIPPSLLRPTVGSEISELTMATLGAGVGPGRLRSAAEVCHAVQGIQRDGAAELLPPVRTTHPDPASLWQHEMPHVSDEDAARTSRHALIGVVGLAVATLAMVGMISVEAASVLGLTPPARPHIVIAPHPQAAAADMAARPASETAAATSSQPLVVLARLIDDTALPDAATRTAAPNSGNARSSPAGAPAKPRQRLAPD